MTYLSWATFRKIIPEPQGNKKKYFAKAHETCLKDLLIGHLEFYNLTLLLFMDWLVCGTTTCSTILSWLATYIIMDNMIVEDGIDEHTGQYVYNFDNDGRDVCNYDNMEARVTVSHSAAPKLDAFIKNYKNFVDNKTHHHLKEKLIYT
jgi:hypothetical protein